MLQTRKVIICAGSGGVGKTTISALAGLAGGMIGKKTLIVTIDPARRLAQALGIEEVSSDPVEITGRMTESDLRPRSEVWAMMLDMRNAFDTLVRGLISDQERLDQIFANRIYSNLTRSLSGSHEYAAMHKLWDLCGSGEWDLIILDTPPTTHALDFLEAPGKLSGFFHSKVVELFLRDGSAAKYGVSLLQKGSDILAPALERLIGKGLISQIAEFFSLVDVLLQPFDEESGQVEELLHSPDVEFLIVCGPSPSQTDEAGSFFRALKEMNIQAGALVVNRTIKPVLSRYCSVDLEPGDPLQIVQQVDKAARLYESSYHMLEQYVGKGRLFKVPMGSEDVHSLAGLIRIGEELFGDLFSRKS